MLVPADLYWAGRATLVSRPDDLATYDRVFAEVFGPGSGASPAGDPPPEIVIGAREIDATEEGDEPDAVETRAALASRAERLRTRSFADLTEDELRELMRLCGRLRLVAPTRRTRRRRRTRRGDLDLRATMRRALRTGGDPVDVRRRQRRERPRQVVLLLDISGSMSAFSRGLLLFAHAALLADRRWEAFSFGTRLTRLTAALRASDPHEALRAATASARDWDGGTRIGESLQSLLATYGRGELVRGAVVVVCSDGLDVGDPELLSAQMERLHRLAHRVVWLNPLSANPAYEPLARGMAAALPHVDRFASGHSLAELESVAAALARL